MSAQYIKDALNIGELEYTLTNISNDDNRTIESYSVSEVVAEAEYVLSCFHESGHINNDWLNGDDGDPREARAQVRALGRFIKKYKTLDTGSK